MTYGYILSEIPLKYLSLFCPYSLFPFLTDVPCFMGNTFEQNSERYTRDFGEIVLYTRGDQTSGKYYCRNRLFDSPGRRKFALGVTTHIPTSTIIF